MANQKHECDLDTCFLCTTCIKDWKPAIAVNKKNIFIKKGQQIFKEGDPVSGIYFVYSGNIKVHKKWDNERELILRFAKKGDILGHTGIGIKATYPISATALEPAVVCYMDMEFFESSLNINNHFTIKLMHFFASELQASEKRMRNLVTTPVKGRVAQAILTLKDQFGLTNEGHINIELPRQDLASFAGTAYESLFRTLNDLVEEQIISLSGKNILIKDEPRLMQLIAEN